jgi:hypothetical protein
LATVICGLRRPSASNWSNSGEIGAREVFEEVKDEEESKFGVELEARERLYL